MCLLVRMSLQLGGFSDLTPAQELALGAGKALLPLLKLLSCYVAV